METFKYKNFTKSQLDAMTFDEIANLYLQDETLGKLPKTAKKHQIIENMLLLPDEVETKKLQKDKIVDNIKMNVDMKTAKSILVTMFEAKFGEKPGKNLTKEDLICSLNQKPLAEPEPTFNNLTKEMLKAFSRDDLAMMLTEIGGNPGNLKKMGIINILLESKPIKAKRSESPSIPPEALVREAPMPQPAPTMKLTKNELIKIHVDKLGSKPPSKFNKQQIIDAILAANVKKAVDEAVQEKTVEQVAEILEKSQCEVETKTTPNPTMRLTKNELIEIHVVEVGSKPPSRFGKKEILEAILAATAKQQQPATKPATTLPFVPFEQLEGVYGPRTATEYALDHYFPELNERDRRALRNQNMIFEYDVDLDATIEKVPAILKSSIKLIKSREEEVRKQLEYVEGLIPSGKVGPIFRKPKLPTPTIDNRLARVNYPASKLSIVPEEIMSKKELENIANQYRIPIMAGSTKAELIESINDRRQMKRPTKTCSTNIPVQIISEGPVAEANLTPSNLVDAAINFVENRQQVLEQLAPTELRQICNQVSPTSCSNLSRQEMIETTSMNMPIACTKISKEDTKKLEVLNFLVNEKFTKPKPINPRNIDLNLEDAYFAGARAVQLYKDFLNQCPLYIDFSDCMSIERSIYYNNMPTKLLSDEYLAQMEEQGRKLKESDIAHLNTRDIIEQLVSKYKRPINIQVPFPPNLSYISNDIKEFCNLMSILPDKKNEDTIYAAAYYGALPTETLLPLCKLKQANKNFSQSRGQSRGQSQNWETFKPFKPFDVNTYFEEIKGIWSNK